MTWDFTVLQQLKITMEHFISSLLEDVQVSGIVKTPATENLFITRETRLLDETETIEFHSQVAKLLYLAKRTRPDVLLAVSFLTTRVQKPDIDDYWSWCHSKGSASPSATMGQLEGTDDILDREALERQH
jgi:hypothetical protein